MATSGQLHGRHRARSHGRRHRSTPSPRRKCLTRIWTRAGLMPVLSRLPHPGSARRSTRCGADGTADAPALAHPGGRCTRAHRTDRAVGVVAEVRRPCGRVDPQPLTTIPNTSRPTWPETSPPGRAIATGTTRRPRATQLHRRRSRRGAVDRHHRAPARASARSRTCSPTGSSATAAAIAAWSVTTPSTELSGQTPHCHGPYVSLASVDGAPGMNLGLPSWTETKVGLVSRGT